MSRSHYTDKHAAYSSDHTPLTLGEIYQQASVAKDGLTAVHTLVKAALESWCHHLLYVRRVYPVDSFDNNYFLGIRCKANRHPDVVAYISQAVQVAVPALVTAENKVADEFCVEVVDDYCHSPFMMRIDKEQSETRRVRRKRKRNSDEFEGMNSTDESDNDDELGGVDEEDDDELVLEEDNRGKDDGDGGVEVMLLSSQEEEEVKGKEDDPFKTPPSRGSKRKASHGSQEDDDSIIEFYHQDDYDSPDAHYTSRSKNYPASYQKYAQDDDDGGEGSPQQQHEGDDDNSDAAAADEVLSPSKESPALSQKYAQDGDDGSEGSPQQQHQGDDDNSDAADDASPSKKYRASSKQYAQEDDDKRSPPSQQHYARHYDEEEEEPPSPPLPPTPQRYDDDEYDVEAPKPLPPTPPRPSQKYAQYDEEPQPSQSSLPSYAKVDADVGILSSLGSHSPIKDNEKNRKIDDREDGKDNMKEEDEEDAGNDKTVDDDEEDALPDIPTEDDDTNSGYSPDDDNSQGSDLVMMEHRSLQVLEKFTLHFSHPLESLLLPERRPIAPPTAPEPISEQQQFNNLFKQQISKKRQQQLNKKRVAEEKAARIEWKQQYEQRLKQVLVALEKSFRDLLLNLASLRRDRVISTDSLTFKIVLHLCGAPPKNDNDNDRNSAADDDDEADDDNGDGSNDNNSPIGVGDLLVPPPKILKEALETGEWYPVGHETIAHAGDGTEPTFRLPLYQSFVTNDCDISFFMERQQKKVEPQQQDDDDEEEET